MSASPNLPSTRDTAFFFDFDGTLVDLASTPDSVRVSPRVVPLLGELSRLAGGALALVSGRMISDIDAFLSPLVLPIAGAHGAERRDHAGRVTLVGVDDERLASMRQALEQTVRENPGMLLEIKGSALALHYRGAPTGENAARDAAQAQVSRHADSHVLQPGKMVYEIKPKGIDKGRAIRAFMAEPPFAGRTPLFAGDDLTDEKGFDVVNAAGGVTIKVGEVGEGGTHARARVESVDAFIGWLERTVGSALGAQHQ